MRCSTSRLNGEPARSRDLVHILGIGSMLEKPGMLASMQEVPELPVQSTAGVRLLIRSDS